MKSLNERAADLLQGCETVILSSVNQEGYPRPVPLSKIASEGISEIWRATGEHSVKTIDFRSNPKAGLCFYAGLKQKYWQDWFIAHIPKGPTDPEYVLLKFRSEHATFWIDGQFVHRNI